MATPEMAVLGGGDISTPVRQEKPEGTQHQRRGLLFRRYYTNPDVHPFDQIEWEFRTAVISNEKGETIFEQKNVEVPKSWSMTATNVVVSKYFHGKIGTPQREMSVRQLVNRVSRTMTEWGKAVTLRQRKTQKHFIRN
jgi:ribonucleoside-diphosphate reductase alpha chain